MRCSWRVPSPLCPEAMDPLRRLLRVLVPLAALVLVVVPAFVIFRAGWLALGQGEASSMERWVLFAVFNLAWVLAVAVLDDLVQRSARGPLARVGSGAAPGGTPAAPPRRGTAAPREAGGSTP